MNDNTVKNWMAKAENDLKIGKDEVVTENPATDGVCFHMQQCVEKYLKAYLVYHGVELRKTHDIAELIEQYCEINGGFEELQKIGAIELTDYAVEIRYAEEIYFPTLGETRAAIAIAERVRYFCEAEAGGRGA